MKIWEIQNNIHQSGHMIFGNPFNNYDDVDDDDACCREQSLNWTVLSPNTHFVEMYSLLNFTNIIPYLL